MELIAGLTSTVALVALAAAWVMSIIAGAKQGVLWAVALIFIPVFSQLAFAFSHKEESRRWVRFAILGTVLLFLSVLLASIPVLGLLVIAGAVVFVVLRSRNRDITGVDQSIDQQLANLSQGFSENTPISKSAVSPQTIKQPNLLQQFWDWLTGNSEELVVSGIAFSSARIREVGQVNASLLSNWNGTVSVGQIRKAFESGIIVQETVRFQQKFPQLLVNRPGDPYRINGSREPLNLFLATMQKKYQLAPRASATLLVYVHDESAYLAFAKELLAQNSSDLSAHIESIVRQNIYRNQEPNYRHIQRLLLENGHKKNGVTIDKIERQYNQIRERLSIEQFEKSLENDEQTTFVSPEEQMRLDRTWEEISRRISQELDISTDSYYIVPPDYSRDSRIDRFYRDRFAQVLSRAFDGHCCKCGEGMGQLQYDHFWYPKSAGGNFLMRSRSGLYVNNCIPLCGSCNASKGKRDFRDFFTEDELVEVIQKSQSINTVINERMAAFVDTDFPERAF